MGYICSMRERLSRNILISIALFFVSTGIFTGGFVTGAYYYDVLPSTFPLAGRVITADDIEINQEAGATPKDLQQDFKPFWESFELLQENFVDQPLDTTKLVQGAIRGMLKATGDKNTSYMTPIEQDMMSENMSGEIEGIGAEVDTNGEYLRVIAPLPGSPAEEAGMLPGDIIIAVDGKDVSDIDPFEVIGQIRGPAGTIVSITLKREGLLESLVVEITRYNFVVASVESEKLANQIAYVKINRFGDRTEKELRRQLRTLLSDDTVGLILDLRNNPGGFLDAGIAVTSQFINNQVVMMETFGDGREREYRSRRDGLATDIPLVVLINRGSASASEIVASAVKDYKRGTLVGETTYGKGTVQTWINLTDNRGSVRITFARWVGPLGNSIDGQGVEPDIEIQPSYEDYQSNIDPQLDAALALFLENN